MVKFVNLLIFVGKPPWVTGKYQFSFETTTIPVVPVAPTIPTGYVDIVETNVEYMKVTVYGDDILICLIASNPESATHKLFKYIAIPDGLLNLALTPVAVALTVAGTPVATATVSVNSRCIK